MRKQWTGTRGNLKANPALKTKMGNNKNHKYTKYNENKWPTEWAAISQKVVTQQYKLN